MSNVIASVERYAELCRKLEAWSGVVWMAPERREEVRVIMRPLAEEAVALYKELKLADAIIADVVSARRKRFT